ncbi:MULTISPECIES: 4Fe-4S dicluster domain-containing protein [Treponema]|jgi:heterodisulfide reductase subunit C|uniref:4Fe-4S dicluster domain-containing protein n=1 Tax=Treponema rectale TaxID=744512 RepID=A0A840SBD7_9SPIR|nr:MULTISPECIES: 4Fe-4S dicluster domain-containing protein [Treponema]MBB5218144.1 heterodisulfide reductase subunit C [Treponema rectale]MBE6354476.1 4Fe-4S dicluster domain-containing protein [Treponema sp.]MBO6177463.1 4Fe-4S dicluster domain-containing protein [Treponema sp.]QOS40148.1 4Fe-4S dicluster domain-containing protein [Treponema rectale]
MLKSEIELAKSQILEISGVNPKKCMVCGKCSGTCPNYDAMEYHPHQFVQMVENGEIEKLLESKSIYACMSCFACLERCPRQVEPVKLIEAVRQFVERKKENLHLKAEMVPPALDEDMPQQAIVSAFRKYKK